MKVFVFEPEHTPVMKEIDGSLESMQKQVHGLIQIIYPFDDEEICLVCNEEGKLLSLKPNRPLRDENGDIYDVIYGTFFLAKVGKESLEDFPEELIEEYSEIFWTMYVTI